MKNKLLKELRSRVKILYNKETGQYSVIVLESLCADHKKVEIAEIPTIEKARKIRRDRILKLTVPIYEEVKPFWEKPIKPKSKIIEVN